MLEMEGGNYNNYLDWRGDLTFNQDLFNDVDALLLAELIYVDFKELMPSNQRISIKELWDKYSSSHDLIKEQKIFSFIKEAVILFEHMAKTNRFKNLKLFNYQEDLNDSLVKQFCAVTIEITPNIHYIVFKGTDNSLVGWKEDLYMAFCQEVASQKAAIKYLNSYKPIGLFKRYPRLIIGGHSKGGNLAVYGSANCLDKIQRNIDKIYSFDGPGYHKDFIESTGFRAIVDRCHLFLPEGSVFGLLLNHQEKRVVIKSNANNTIMQHSGLSWIINVNKFSESDNLQKRNMEVIDEFMESIKHIDESTGIEIVDKIFDVFSKANISNIYDLPNTSFSDITKALEAIKNLNPNDREVILNLFKALFKISTSRK